MPKYKFTIPLTVDVVIETDKPSEQAYKIAVKEVKKYISKKEVYSFSSKRTDRQYLSVKNYRVRKDGE